MNGVHHYIMSTNLFQNNPEQILQLKTELENEYKIPAIDADVWDTGNSERLVVLNLHRFMAKLLSDAIK